MRKKTNPLAMLVLMVIVVLALFVAVMVKKMLPAGAEQFSGLIFWGIVIVIGGVGSLLVGRFLNKR